MSATKRPMKSNKQQSRLVKQGTKYVGSISAPGSKGETFTTRRLLRRASNITVGIGGIVIGNFPSDPSGCSGWSDLASAYSEFRVLGMRVDYMARNRYLSNGLPIYVFVDRINTTTDPVNISEATDHESLKMGDTNDHWFHEWKMDGEDEAAFIPTGNPSVSIPGSIKYICNAGVLTNGAVLGEVVVTHLVEFRGSR